MSMSLDVHKTPHARSEAIFPAGLQMIFSRAPLASRNNKNSNGSNLAKSIASKCAPRKVDAARPRACMFAYAAISINSRRAELIAQIGSNAATLSRSHPPREPQLAATQYMYAPLVFGGGEDLAEFSAAATFGNDPVLINRNQWPATNFLLSRAGQYGPTQR